MAIIKTNISIGLGVIGIFTSHNDLINGYTITQISSLFLLYETLSNLLKSKDTEHKVNINTIPLSSKILLAWILLATTALLDFAVSNNAIFNIAKIVFLVLMFIRDFEFIYFSYWYLLILVKLYESIVNLYMNNKDYLPQLKSENKNLILFQNNTQNSLIDNKKEILNKNEDNLDNIDRKNIENEFLNSDKYVIEKFPIKKDLSDNQISTYNTNGNLLTAESSLVNFNIEYEETNPNQNSIYIQTQSDYKVEEKKNLDSNENNKIESIDNGNDYYDDDTSIVDYNDILPIFDENSTKPKKSRNLFSKNQYKNYFSNNTTNTYEITEEDD